MTNVQFGSGSGTLYCSTAYLSAQTCAVRLPSIVRYRLWRPGPHAAPVLLVLLWMESSDDSFWEEQILAELRRTFDSAAKLEPRGGPSRRYCSNEKCLCNQVVVLNGHTITCGHVALQRTAAVDVAAVCVRLAASPCTCCKAARAAARRAANAPPKVCFTCKQAGHLVRDCPKSICKNCGGMGHLARDCTLGSDTSRSAQFLTCGDKCFVRRFVVPLHRGE